MTQALYVVVMICAANAPCTPQTARAYQSMRAPQGVILCGIPATLTIAQSPAGPAPDEYIRTRCELRRD